MAIPGSEQVDGPGDLRGRGYISPRVGVRQTSVSPRHSGTSTLREDCLRPAQLSAYHWSSADLQEGLSEGVMLQPGASDQPTASPITPTNSGFSKPQVPPEFLLLRLFLTG
ncbi:hypothetical protein JOQ06_025197 [Pogonophryne albipinna]|uniref:Uncharacterized protein n=1 Tax=Pogonophryne albipinna TaxID=1090488 RepID=A0AAD6ATV2_9TELE|nr:hypothetical protein JOQ06_025197 [Pogonophryne albipinna]